MPDFASLQADPIAFRRAVMIDTDTGPRKLSTILDSWQRADFAALDSGWRKVVGLSLNGTLRAWLERPRGHSKSGDLAVMAAWALFASRRALRGVAAAGDRDQAALLTDAIDRLCRANGWLANVLDVQRDRIVNRHTGSELAVLSSDAPTSYGLTPDFIVVDELTHWKSRELWDSLLSAAAKRSNCLLLVITNAGFQDSWQWETREAVRVDSAWYFSRLDGPRASWITADRLDEQRRLLPPIAFARLWLNQWSSGSGDALEPNDVDAAVTLAGPTHSAEKGWAYIAGLDIGLTRDATGLVVLGKHVGHFVDVEKPATPVVTGTLASLIDCGVVEKGLTSVPEQAYIPGTGRIKLCDLVILRPSSGNASGEKRVSIEEIEARIVAINCRLPLSCVAADPWQSVHLCERLNKQGIPTIGVDFVPANLRSMATETVDAFRERQIDLFDDPTLLADLRSLRVVERGYGFRLVSPRTTTGAGTTHADSATALSLALHAARRIVSAEPLRVNRPLVLWP